MNEVDKMIRTALEDLAGEVATPDPTSLALIKAQVLERSHSMLEQPSNPEPDSPNSNGGPHGHRAGTTARRAIRSRPFSWPAWAAVGLIAAGSGFGLGATGTIGGPAEASRPLADRGLAATGATAPLPAIGLDCPLGQPIGRLEPGDRVLAISRSGDRVEVRDPRDLRRTMWVRASALQLDRNGDSVSDLPEGSCVVPSADGLPAPSEQPAVPIAETPADPGVEAITTTIPGAPPTTGSNRPPSTSPGQQPQPGATAPPGASVAPNPPSGATVPAPPATAAPDTAKPTLGNVVVSPAVVDNAICEAPAPGGWSPTITFRVTASDNIGVSSVQISWPGGPSGLPGGPVAMTLNNGQYVGTVGPFPAGTLPSGERLVTATITARDAAGNQQTTTANFTLVASGWCLI